MRSGDTEETAHASLIKPRSCPFKGCTRKFNHHSGVSKHVKMMHNTSIRSLLKAYSCPYKDVLECRTSFSSRSAVCNHVKRVNGTSMPLRPKQYPCPLKGQLKCDANFGARRDVARHVKQVHKVDYNKEFGPPRPKVAYECPRRNDLDCPKRIPLLLAQPNTQSMRTLTKGFHAHVKLISIAKRTLAL